MSVTGVEPHPFAAELASVRARLEATRDGTTLPELFDVTDPALDELAHAFRLSTFERGLIVLAAGVELDAGIAELAATLQHSDDPRPTVALGLQVLRAPHWDALAPSSPLRYWRLVELDRGVTLATRSLRIDERILHHLTGITAPDERLAGVVHIPVDTVPLAPSQCELALDLARRLRAVAAPALVRIDGDDRAARMGVAQAIAAALGYESLLVRADSLPGPGSELATFSRLIDREALLLGAVPVVDADGPSGPFAALLQVPVVITLGAGATHATDRIVFAGSVELPRADEQRDLWTSALGDELAPTIDELAQHYRFSASEIRTIGLEAASADAVEVDGFVRRRCRERARVGLEGLAERIVPLATWDDLVLPAAHTAVLHDIERHVRHRAQVYERWGFAERANRGLGITALFSGESGTGKTLAAEVLAGALDLDLYRIDLAATVSKYIGETEKNLRRIFDAAESSGAVLLFDEADALFGKRGEVRDGHDRYANLEVAYLLQRMESYRGLAILTTNLRTNLDRAFLRRLRFVVQFPFPDEAGRAAIWQRAFPADAPVDRIDPRRLARLAVTGASIRAIALSAAFAAADEGCAITPAHVLSAARVEYAKHERTLTDTETAGLR